MSLSLDKILKNPECYMDTDEKFFNKINLHNINQLKVLKDPSVLPLIVNKKIKRNDEKIDMITRNDDRFTELQKKRLDKQLKSIQTNINKMTNIQEYSFKSLNTKKLRNIKNLKYIFDEKDSSFDKFQGFNNDNSTKNNTHQINNDSNHNIERHRNIQEDIELKDDQYFNKEKIINRSRNSNFRIRNYMSLQTIVKPLSKNLYQVTHTSKKPDSPERDRNYELLENVENPDLTSPVTNKKYYKKLLKLKNYDNVVKNLANVKKLVISDKLKLLKSSLSRTINKSIYTNCIVKSISGISNIKSLSPFNNKNKTPLFTSRNCGNLQKKNTINNLSRIEINDNSFDSLIKRKSDNKINNLRKSVVDITDKLMDGNHKSNIKEIVTQDKKYKSIDRHKLELYKIYKTSIEKEAYLKKLKKNKKYISFDKYQKMLMEYMQDKISLDSMNDLYSKFKEVKGVCQRVEKLPLFDNEKDLIKFNEMVDNIKASDYKKNTKIREEIDEVVKHKFYKKDKMDYNLKKIEHIIPNYLLEKLKNNKM